jgi:hypothetical protein
LCETQKLLDAMLPPNSAANQQSLVGSREILSDDNDNCSRTTSADPGTGSKQGREVRKLLSSRVDICGLLVASLLPRRCLLPAFHSKAGKDEYKTNGNFKLLYLRWKSLRFHKIHLLTVSQPQIASHHV